MKSNFEIVREEYNPTTYESIVEIHTNLGNFIGTTIADEEDQIYPSQFQGNAIAMSKALKKYAKAAIRQLKAELTVADRMLSAWGWSQPDKNEPHYDIYLQHYRYYKDKCVELELWQTRLRNLDTGIENRISARNRILQSYREKEKMDKRD